MIMVEIVYFLLTFAALAALAGVIYRIGGALEGCPAAGAAARMGALVVTTAFACIGAGVIAIIGASLPLLVESTVTGLYVALGCVSIVLGIGFASASRALRDIVDGAVQRQKPVTEG